MIIHSRQEGSQRTRGNIKDSIDISDFVLAEDYLCFYSQHFATNISLNTWNLILALRVREKCKLETELYMKRWTWLMFWLVLIRRRKSCPYSEFHRPGIIHGNILIWLGEQVSLFFSRPRTHASCWFHHPSDTGRQSHAWLNTVISRKVFKPCSRRMSASLLITWRGAIICPFSPRRCNSIQYSCLCIP